MPVKVMIVDNVQARRQGLEGAFSRAGFEVCSAGDSLGCSLKLRSERPDLVVLEAKLPVVSGLQILQNLRKSRQERVPSVILLVEEGDVGSLSEGESDLHELYLTKPISPETLVATARQMLAEREWRPAPPAASPCPFRDIG
ncbi:MAG: PleD family two-component system response regulator [Armatimonadota bacterium]